MIDSKYVLLNLNNLDKVIDANKIIELYCYTIFNLYNNSILTIKYKLILLHLLRNDFRKNNISKGMFLPFPNFSGISHNMTLTLNIGKKLIRRKFVLMCNYKLKSNHIFI